MKRLIVCVGLPRSGKSTWSAQHGAPVVCPDAIRLAIHGQKFVPSAEPFVWAVAKTMVPALFQAGHDVVILDATNGTRASRASWIQPTRWTTEWRVFETSADLCLERARLTAPELEPVILRMIGAWEPLTLEELAVGAPTS